MSEFHLEVMNHIDPALVEEIDLTGAKKRRMPARLRAGLIAACVCLALVGTVFAASVAVSGFHRIESYNDHFDARTDRTYEGYTGYGGIGLIPLNELSPELLDFAQENLASTVSLPVSGLEELEELTGLELPDSLTVDGLEYRGFAAQLSADSVGPTYIEYSETYRSLREDSSGHVLRVDVSLLTELMYSPDIELHTGACWPSDYTVSTAEYTTGRGLSVLLTEYRYPEDSVEYEMLGAGAGGCSTCFALNGVWYRLDVHGGQDAGKATELLKDVLETFQL